MTNPSQQPSEVEDELEEQLYYLFDDYGNMELDGRYLNTDWAVYHIKQLFHQHLATEVEKVLDRLEASTTLTGVNRNNPEFYDGYKLADSEIRSAIHKERQNLKK